MRRTPLWMHRRRLLLGLIVMLIIAAPAGADIAGRKQSVDARIGRLQTQIAAAKQREAALAEDIAVATTQIRTLEHQVGDVSGQLVVLERDLALHRQRLAHLSELLNLQTRRLLRLGREYKLARTRFDRRLVAIYQQDDTTTMDVVLSARSFTDLLERLDYSRQIGSQDEAIARDVSAARAELRDERARTRRTKRAVASATRVISVRTAQVRAIRERLVARKTQLAAARGEKQRAFASTRVAAREAAGEAAALASVSNQLAAQIEAARVAEAARAAEAARTPAPAPRAVAAPTAAPTPSASGLVWPVSGPVTSPFGMRWGRMHEGIDIGAPSGTAIHAAASGLVIYAGWMGGYGNLMIVDHGGGLATAYGHQSGFAVGSGTQVAQGQVIGFVGCTGHCFGPHLHFEVRVNGSPVDPLGYL